jgi:hypothetical protein
MTTVQLRHGCDVVAVGVALYHDIVLAVHKAIVRPGRAASG